MKKLILQTLISVFYVAAIAQQNVGIGTNNPQTKLQVAGAISSTPASAAAASSVVIPDNVTTFQLTTGAGPSALSVAHPQDGQFLNIQNDDTHIAIFATFTIPAGGMGSFLYLVADGAWKQVANNNSGSNAFTAGNGLGWSGTTLNSVWTQTGSNISNNNAGNVGIGTTTPGYSLDIAGYVRASGELIGTLGSGSAQFRAVNGNYGLMLRNDGSNSYLLLTASGSPYGGWNSLRPFMLNDATGDITLANDVFMQQSTGYEGIGTTSPSAQLHTTGTVRFQNYPNGILSTDANGNLLTTPLTLTGTANQIDVTNGNGVSGNPIVAIDPAYTAELKSQAILTGGGTVTYSGGYLSWSNRFIVINNGNGPQFSTNGYFDITQPPSGTVITGYGSTGNVTATASGIPLGCWDALYYIMPIGSSNTSQNGNFIIAQYNGAFVVPPTWILIANNNCDDSSLRLGNGTTLISGQSANEGSGAYINNGTASQSANFNISGNGTIGSTLQVGSYGSMTSTPTSWGTIGLTGTTGGYYGILYGPASVAPNLMYDGAGNGGFYYPGIGTWETYYTASNQYFGIGTTTPRQKLDIGGNIAMNGRLAFSDQADGWLRLNQNSDYSNGAYTPGFLRADGGIASGPVGGLGGGTIIATSTIRGGGYQDYSTGNQVIDAGGGWHISYGATGWYNGTYGIGIYASDGTWIRTYNNASIWANTGTIATNGSFSCGYGTAGGPSGGAIFSGSVGIGTTSPGYTLQVNGNAKILDNYFYVDYNQGGSGGPPVQTNAGALAVSGNWTSGDAEVDFWNATPNVGSNRGFWFWALTGTNTYTTVAEMNQNGSLTVGSVNYFSDSRLKKDITPLAEDETSKLFKINTYSYKFDKAKMDAAKISCDDVTHFGVLAQELEKLYPNLVQTDSRGIKSVNYTELIPVMIESLKSQNEKIQGLNEKIQSLQSESDKINILEKEIEELKAKK